MFLKQLRNWTSKIHIRFGILFSLIFLVCSAVLFSVILFSLYSSMRRADQDFLNNRLIGYWARYQLAGMQGLREQLRLESLVPSDKLYLVRIEDRTGETFFYLIPEMWQQLDISQFDATGPDSVNNYLTFELPSSQRLFMRGLELSDGYVVQIALDMQWRDSLFRNFENRFLMILGLMVMLCFAAGVLVSYRALRPLVFLNRAIDVILATGNRQGRIPQFQSGDQLDELARKYNRMMDRIDLLVTGMQESIDNTAHDIRTPLTSLRGTAELALQHTEDPARMKEALETCVEQTDRILAMVKTYLKISAAEHALDRESWEPVNLAESFVQVMEMYSFLFEEKDIDVVTKLDPVPPILADPAEIRQVLGNLLDNALKFSPAGSRVSVQIGLIRNEPPSETTELVEFRIIDQGPGIPPEDTEKIWRRLYRGRTHGSAGLGLGLSLVKAVVESTGGTVGLYSQGQGSEFFLRIPPANITKL